MAVARGWWGRAGNGELFNRYTVSVQEYETVLEVDGMMVAEQCECVQCD